MSRPCRSFRRCTGPCSTLPRLRSPDKRGRAPRRGRAYTGRRCNRPRRRGGNRGRSRMRKTSHQTYRPCDAAHGKGWVCKDRRHTRRVRQEGSLPQCHKPHTEPPRSRDHTRSEALHPILCKTHDRGMSSDRNARRTRSRPTCTRRSRRRRSHPRRSHRMQRRLARHPRAKPQAPQRLRT